MFDSCQIGRAACVCAGLPDPTGAVFLVGEEVPVALHPIEAHNLDAALIGKLLLPLDHGRCFGKRKGFLVGIDAAEEMSFRFCASWWPMPLPGHRHDALTL